MYPDEKIINHMGIEENLIKSGSAMTMSSDVFEHHRFFNIHCTLNTNESLSFLLKLIYNRF